MSSIYSPNVVKLKRPSAATLLQRGFPNEQPTRAELDQSM